MISLWRPSPVSLTDLVSAQKREGRFSYADVGATRSTLPAGYRHDHWVTDLGDNTDDRFGRAVDALRHWAPQRGAGIEVVSGEPVTEDLTFVLLVAVGPLYVTAAGRVVYIDDGPDCYRFAYGTLEAHPESGEESFAVARSNGRVRFEVTAFSRPFHPLARLGSPITRAMQLRTTRAYLAAMERAVSS